MINMKFLFYLLMLSILTSCKQNDYETFLIDKIQNIFGNEIRTIDAFVILPGQGCSGCISEGEKFLIENSRNYPNVRFVLTKIVSKKILKQKIGGAIYNAPNVYIDSLGVFTSTTFHETIYPVILYAEQGELVDIEYQSPNNPHAVYKLSTRILNEYINE